MPKAKVNPAVKPMPNMVYGVMDTNEAKAEDQFMLHYDSVEDLPDEYNGKRVGIYVLEDVKTLVIGKRLED